ncbi:MAG: hypothetical protein WBG70_18865 [Spirulinaceae cyanobacterium]
MRIFAMQIQGSVLLTSLLITGLVNCHYQTASQPQKPLQFEALQKETVAQGEQKRSDSRGDGRREEDERNDKKQQSSSFGTPSA